MKTVSVFHYDPDHGGLVEENLDKATWFEINDSGCLILYDEMGDRIISFNREHWVKARVNRV